MASSASSLIPDPDHKPRPPPALGAQDTARPAKKSVASTTRSRLPQHPEVCRRRPERVDLTPLFPAEQEVSPNAKRRLRRRPPIPPTSLGRIPTPAPSSSSCLRSCQPRTAWAGSAAQRPSPSVYGASRSRWRTAVDVPAWHRGELSKESAVLWVTRWRNDRLTVSHGLAKGRRNATTVFVGNVETWGRSVPGVDALQLLQVVGAGVGKAWVTTADDG